MKFELSPKEEAKFLAWSKEQDKKSALKQLANLSEEALAERRAAGFKDDEPYDGAIGGRYTFSFTPVGVGLIIKVSNGLTEDTIDLTDYDSW